MDFYLSQIIYWACNFAPKNWGSCNGALYSISSNQALYSLIGATYGGDGRTSFGLPDLRGRAPIGYMQGNGLSNYRLGQRTGAEYVYLNILELPAHNHTASLSGVNINVEMNVSSTQADAHTPSPGSSIAAPYDSTNLAGVEGFNSLAPDTTIAGASGTISGGNITIENTGAQQAHPNMQPSLALNPCILMMGIFPSRN